jgi:hypothetical protein
MSSKLRTASRDARLISYGNRQAQALWVLAWSHRHSILSAWTLRTALLLVGASYPCVVSTFSALSTAHIQIARICFRALRSKSTASNLRNGSRLTHDKHQDLVFALPGIFANLTACFHHSSSAHSYMIPYQHYPCIWHQSRAFVSV